jgi:hypothetical protein
VEPRLAAIEVKAGQKVRGNVVFDVAQGHQSIYWEPLFAKTPAAFAY